VIGATITPTGMPALASRSMAWMRRFGVATPGSMARDSSGSQMGMLMATCTDASRCNCQSTSRSRSTRGALVTMATGLRNSRRPEGSCGSAAARPRSVGSSR